MMPTPPTAFERRRWLRRAAGSLLAPAAVLAAAGAGAASPAPLGAPGGAVVLTVTGKLRAPNQGEQAMFDMAMLERLPQASFVAQTPWYPQPRKFTGPRLRDVLAAAGAQGRLLRASALNDYRVDIPFEDAERWDVIVARLLDDRPMPVRDKGPLFIVYPFDSDAQLRDAVHYSRAIWQLKSIEVL